MALQALFDLFVVDLQDSLAGGAARQHVGLIGVELRRRRDMGVNVDDHETIPLGSVLNETVLNVGC